MNPAGSLLCLASAAAFGTMAIFGKLAYGEGADVTTLLAVRFTMAAAVLWVVVLAKGGLPRLARRDVGMALALGACGYALQAGCYFLSLERIDASLLSLVLYTYPAIVAVAAVLLGRERLEARRVAALALVSIGLVLVLSGAGIGALDGAGVALAVAAALAYSTYILVSDGVAGRMPALALATLVCTGAAVSLLVGTTLAGTFHPELVSAAGWGWLACLAGVSTVGGIVMFFAGLRRVGPSSASILSTIEPVVTVALAAAVFSERLDAVQLVGGALVLAAVVVLRATFLAWPISSAVRGATSPAVSASSAPTGSS